MRFVPRADCQIPSLGQIYEEHLTEPTGRFVEVGAYDGVAFSNTVMLAEAGWRGLYVEPHPGHAEKCARNHAGRDGIKVERVAVSDFDGVADFYEIGECSSLVWDQNTIDWGGKKEAKFQVTVTTLDSLLKRLHWEPKFDVLVIDVEGNELKVLAEFSLLVWLPKLVIIEAHEKDNASIRNFKAGPINDYFEAAQYRKIYADHINSVFLRKG